MLLRAFGRWVVPVLAWLAGTLLVSAQEAGSTDVYELIRRFNISRGDVTARQMLYSMTINGQTEQNGRTVSFELYQRDSGEIRYEALVDGRTSIQIYDGKEGWVWYANEPELGARRMSPAQVRFFRLNATLESPLNDLYEYSFHATYVGMELNEGRYMPEHHLRLESARYGDILDLWIDGQHFRETRRAYRPTPDAEPLVTRFSDYRKTGGLWIAYSVWTEFAGQELSRSVVQEAVANQGLLSFLFTKPASYKEAAGEDAWTSP